MTEYAGIPAGGAVVGGSASTAKLSMDAVLRRPPRWRLKFKMPRISLKEAIDWVLRIFGLFELGHRLGLYRKTQEVA